MADKPFDPHKELLLRLAAQQWRTRTNSVEQWDEKSERALAVGEWLTRHRYQPKDTTIDYVSTCLTHRFTPALACSGVDHDPGIREASTADITLAGYAAVFHDPNNVDTEYRLDVDLVEHIAPGAFTRTLGDGHDIKKLWQHQPANVMGSTGARTLRLHQDRRGLWFEVAPPKTATSRHWIENIRRGDVAGCSFGFILGPDDVEFSTRSNDLVARIINLELLETSVVTFPAYPATSVQVVETDARSLFGDDDDDVEEDHGIEQRDDGDAEPDWDAELQWLHLAAAEGRRALARHCNDYELRLAQERGLL